MRCFPLLASVLGDQYGVEIRIGGDEAMTDGRIIQLPALPAEPDIETLETARGYVDHESAHIRYTDFEAMRNARLPKLEHWLFNAIEDWRVEKKLAEIFPGCGLNFQKLIKRFFGEGTGAGPKSPALVVLDHVLLTVRSWAVCDVLVRKNRAGEIVDENFPGLKDLLDAILVETQQNCTSTVDAIAYAEKLGQLIRKYVPQANARKEENSQTPEMGAGENSCAHSSSGGGEKEASEQPASAKMEEGDATSKSDGSESESHAGCSQKSSLGNSCSSTRHANDNNNSQSGEKSDEWFTGAGNLPRTMGERLASELNLKAEESEGRLTIATVGRKKVAPFSTAEMSEALRDSVAMRQRLAGLLQSQTMKQGGTGRKGKLDSSCLHRICVGNARVFRREAERIALDVAVHILLDCSYSMTGSSMEMARKACFAIIKALSGAKGINLALTAFPAENNEGVFPVIRHGASRQVMPALDPYGSTLLAPALWWVMRELLPQKEQRKIILLITDGVPDSVKATHQAIAQCEKLNFEVMGIGIECPGISYILPESSKVIWKLRELAPAMFELMQNALLKGGRK